jgi:hypothetical protein
MQTGFAFGVLLGFIMLFWLFESSVSQKQKLGILCGVIFQLGINLWQRAVTDE